MWCESWDYLCGRVWSSISHSDEQLKAELLSPSQVLAESFPVPESCCWLQSGRERGRAGDLNKRKKKVSDYFLVMTLRRDKYLPNSWLILCSLCMNCYIVKVVGALLAKKPMESQSLNVTCIMGNKEILMLRAECSLPSESPLHTGRAASHLALSSSYSEQKAAVTMVAPDLFRQKNRIFSQSPGVSFPLPQHSWDGQGPHSAIQSMGPHPGAAGASLCTAGTVGRVRARIS